MRPRRQNNAPSCSRLRGTVCEKSFSESGTWWRAIKDVRWFSCFPHESERSAPKNPGLKAYYLPRQSASARGSVAVRLRAAAQQVQLSSRSATARTNTSSREPFTFFQRLLCRSQGVSATHRAESVAPLLQVGNVVRGEERLCGGNGSGVTPGGKGRREKKFRLVVAVSRLNSVVQFSMAAGDWIQTSPGCDINRRGEGAGGAAKGGSRVGEGWEGGDHPGL